MTSLVFVSVTSCIQIVFFSIIMQMIHNHFGGVSVWLLFFFRISANKTNKITDTNLLFSSAFSAWRASTIYASPINSECFIYSCCNLLNLTPIKVTWYIYVFVETCFYTATKSRFYQTIRLNLTGTYRLVEM